MTTDAFILRQPDRSIETKGIFTFKNNPFTCVSLELPWKNNEKGVSCIPDGIYEFEKVPATKKIPYEHIHIKNVEGRDGIKIHIANFAAGKLVQIEGCIAPGERFADLNGDGIEDAFNSKTAFLKIMMILPSKGTIEIRTQLQMA